MPKQSSTRSITITRRIGRAEKTAGHGEAGPDAVLLPSEISVDYAEIARQMILESWPAIVKGLIKKAVAGGHQQAKFLLDLYDMKDTEAAQMNELYKQQLCDVLLDSLKLCSGLAEIASGAGEFRDNHGSGPVR